VLFLLHINTVLNYLEDGSLLPKHVAKYIPILIIASCLSVFCVLAVRNIFHKFAALCASDCPQPVRTSAQTHIVRHR